MVQIAATQTSISNSWSPSTDNVGVTGYRIYKDNVLMATITQTSYTLTGLTCGTTYTIGLEAIDAAGNASNRALAQGPESTSPCASGDAVAPSTPTALVTSSIAQTSITLSWAASTDNVGVSGYGRYLNGTLLSGATGTSFTFTGLACGTTYALGVDAYDAAGNRSTTAALNATTSACSGGDITAPTSPTGLTTSGITQTTITLSWTASTDNVGVTGYGRYRDGALLSSATGTSYTFSGLTCGTTYALGVDGFDAAGNRSTRASVNAPTSPCSAPSGAGLFVSPSGSDSNACTQAAPCQNLARAFTLAPAGSTVQLASGNYGCAGIGGSKSADVTFVAASGATPWVTCELDISASHIALNGIKVAGLRMSETASYITLRNVDVTCQDQAPFPLWDGKCSAGIFGAPSHFLMQGGSVGPTWDNGSTSPGNSQIGIPYGGSTSGASDIVFDGVRFHDNRIAYVGVHSECLMLGGGNGVTIRDSRFDHCNIFDLFVTWWNFVSPQYPQPTNLTFENNWFFDTLDHNYTLFFSDHVTSYSGVTVRNNSFTGDFQVNQPSVQNFKVFGNLGPLASYQCWPGVQFSHNVWQDQQSFQCGTGDKAVVGARAGVDNLGFVNAADGGDLHLTSSSPAVDAADPASYPATDMFGQARPMGAGPDAGSVEAR
jgi:chitodextrinase